MFVKFLAAGLVIALAAGMLDTVKPQLSLMFVAVIFLGFLIAQPTAIKDIQTLIGFRKAD